MLRGYRHQPTPAEQTSLPMNPWLHPTMLMSQQLQACGDARWSHTFVDSATSRTINMFATSIRWLSQLVKKFRGRPPILLTVIARLSAPTYRNAGAATVAELPNRSSTPTVTTPAASATIADPSTPAASVTVATATPLAFFCTTVISWPRNGTG